LNGRRRWATPDDGPEGRLRDQKSEGVVERTPPVENAGRSTQRVVLVIGKTKTFFLKRRLFPTGDVLLFIYKVIFSS
jgi:hypothetical protein